MADEMLTKNQIYRLSGAMDEGMTYADWIGKCKESYARSGSEDDFDTWLKAEYLGKWSEMHANGETVGSKILDVLNKTVDIISGDTETTDVTNDSTPDTDGGNDDKGNKPENRIFGIKPVPFYVLAGTLLIGLAGISIIVVKSIKNRK
jgi:hypothetical protein